ADFDKVLRPMAPSQADGYFNEVTLDISEYCGQQGYIAFRHVDRDRTSLCIDDISIVEKVYGPVTTKYSTNPWVALTGLTPGTQYELQVTSQMPGEADATSEPFLFTTGTIDPTIVELDNEEDNNSTISSNDGVLANVTIKNLTLKSGVWTGITLPFAIDDIENSPLAGSDVRTIAGEEVGMIGDVFAINCLTPQSSIAAGYPYFIKWNGASDLINPTFKLVTLSSYRNNVYSADNSVTFIPAAYYAYDVSASSLEFYVTADEVLTYLIPELTGYRQKAFEPYLWVPMSLRPYETTAVVLNTGDNDIITGISSVEGAGDETIYNVAGQRLGKMQKGINIVNGKKVLVK
ncbi:MAG: fibronectin type III domain-containing protein, partial [Bacteroidaceae bacterium]|nr:fibronectin type III domain-containing protein [Bacteroidaceae bacterium]